MTNPCPPSPSEKLLTIEAECKIRTRISMYERLDHLLKDPEQNMGHIETLCRLLETMEKRHSADLKVFTRDRELALAEWRLEVRQESMDLQRLKLEFQRQSPIATRPVEESSGAVSHKEALKKRTRIKKMGEPQSKIEPDQIEVGNSAFSLDKKASLSLQSPQETEEAVVVASTHVSAAPERSTAELQAMEWDLRTTFQFGDLRPFEFCTGSQMIRFPDRTGHPEPAKPNFPLRLHPSSDLASRTDEYVVLPHILPAGFAKGEAKSKSKNELGSQPNNANPARPQRAEPTFKDGVIDWENFVKPLCSGVWPDNTVLPKTWQHGDPIPGGLREEIA